MPKAVKVNTGNITVKTAEELFTDREEPRRAFWDLYDSIDSDSYEVISYYGVGGVGKTSLLWQLQKEMRLRQGQMNYAFFSLEGSPAKEEILFSLASQMKMCCNDITFSRFDAAFDQILREQGKDPEKYREEIGKTLAVSAYVELAADLLFDLIPGAGVAAKALNMAQKAVKERKEKKESDKGFALVYGHTRKELVRDLHKYFREDVSEALSRRKQPFVFFLDGYEKYVSLLKDGELSAGSDHWISDADDGLVNMPNTLWVIAGREEPDWDTYVLPEEHRFRMGNLSEKDTAGYFRKAGVREDLIPSLYELTKGMPVYLDLCKETYFKKINSGKEPQPEDFGSEAGDLARIFLLDMDKSSREAIYVLSWLPNTWDSDLVERIAAGYGIPAPHDVLSTILKLSLFEPVEEGTYNLYKFHEIVRNVTRSISAEKSGLIQKAALAAVKEDLREEEASVLLRLEQFCYMVENYRPEVVSEVFPEKDFMEVLELLAKEERKSGAYHEFGRLFAMLKNYVEKSDTGACVRVSFRNKENQNAGNRGDFEDLIENAEQTYAYAVKNLGERDLLTIAALNHLANACHSAGNYAKAAEMHEKCYEVRKQALGEDHPATIGSLNNLANVYQYMGDYKRSAEMHERCYEARKQVLGEESPAALGSLNNLALALISLGEFEKAMVLHEKCYAGRKQVLGENHPVTLRSLNNLANVYRNMGNYRQSVAIHEKCHEARTRVLGEKHPDTLSSLSNLALGYADLGEFEKALVMHQKCYEIRKELLGENHPSTLSSLSHLAGALKGTGNYEKAAELQEKSYTAQKEILGENHPHTLIALSDLASALSLAGRNEKALEMLKACLKEQEKNLGENHPDTIDTMEHLAKVYRDMKQYRKAKELYEKCYELRKKAWGEDHPAAKAVLTQLAAVYADVGEYEKSAASLKKAMH